MSRFKDHQSAAPRVSLWLLTLFASATVASCGSAGVTSTPTTSPNVPPTTSKTINATPQIAFSPAHLTVTQGDTVTFAFGSVGHNVYFDNDPNGAPANIPGVNSNSSVPRVFATAGVFNFYCHIHPGMQGTITVAPPDTA